MAASPPGELKLATTIPIERAEVTDEDEQLTQQIRYKENYCTELRRPYSEVCTFPVEDPQKTFQALLNVRDVAHAITLKELKVKLTSGEDGVAGAVYEGRWYMRRRSVSTKLVIVETENSEAYKRLEISAKHTFTEIGNVLHETWIFEVLKRPENGAWELIYRWMKGRGYNDLELAGLVLFTTYVSAFAIPLAIALFPLTILAAVSYVKNQKTKMVPFYRYILDFDGGNGPTVAERVELGRNKRGVQNQALTETEELHMLFELFKSGALTKEEYERQKEKIIGV